MDSLEVFVVKIESKKSSETYENSTLDLEVVPNMRDVLDRDGRRDRRISGQW